MTRIATTAAALAVLSAGTAGAQGLDRSGRAIGRDDMHRNGIGVLRRELNGQDGLSVCFVAVWRP